MDGTKAVRVVSGGVIDPIKIRPITVGAPVPPIPVPVTPNIFAVLIQQSSNAAAMVLAQIAWEITAAGTDQVKLARISSELKAAAAAVKTGARI